MILCVGALTPRKGTDTMLKASEIFLPQLLGWKLHLVGLDVNREYQRKFLESANSDVAARVVFEGFLDEESLKERYLRCGIYFTTSLIESFGLPCLEAMRRGKALVATNAGALPELVQHEVNGFVFEPGDYQTAAEYVVRLAQNQELRRDMGSRSLEFARKNSDMEVVCRQYEKIPLTLKKLPH
jgi:glycosyltransferase involved in cell wall biosynthesis